MIVTVFPGSKLPVCKKKIGNGCLDIFKHYKKAKPYHSTEKNENIFFPTRLFAEKRHSYEKTLRHNYSDIWQSKNLHLLLHIIKNYLFFSCFSF
jgi:hypothetical protein